MFNITILCIFYILCIHVGAHVRCIVNVVHVWYMYPVCMHIQSTVFQYIKYITFLHSSCCCLYSSKRSFVTVITISFRQRHSSGDSVQRTWCSLSPSTQLLNRALRPVAWHPPASEAVIICQRVNEMMTIMII